MGKERTVGARRSGTKASSSSEAASLLGTTGTGFIGFSGFSSVGETENLDPEYQLSFKALNKKDPITKLKALQELSGMFKGVTDENVQSVLKLWSQAYNKLALDDDRRVRETCNQTFIILVRSVNKKNLAPYLKSMIGVWLLNIFDPNKEVCIAARNALNAAIPVAKQADAVVFCKKELLSFVQENFEQPPPSTDSVTDFERYERVVSASILSLCFIIDTENQNLAGDYQSILTTKFWSYLTSKSTLIRKSAYRLLTVLCTKLPKLVEPSLEKLSPTILGIFNEKESSAHGNMWECLLSFMKAFPQSWTFIKPKSTLPRLWSFLRNASYGSISTSYPSFLPFVYFIPTEVTTERDFYPEFLSSFWKGLQSDNLNKNSKDILIVLKSYLECLKYFISQARQQNPEVEQDLIRVHLFSVVEYFLTSENSSIDDELLRLLTEALNKIGSNTASEKYIAALWVSTKQFVSSSIERNLAEPTSIPIHNKFPQLCAHFSKHLDNKFLEGWSQVVKHIFLLCLGLSREKHHLPSLQTIKELAKFSDLQSILIGLFEQYLLPWILELVQTSKSSELAELLSFISFYWRISSQVRGEWDTLLKVLLSSSNKVDYVSLAIEKICVNDTDSAIWHSSQLNELALQITTNLSADNFSDSLILSKKLLSALISSLPGSILDENTQIQIASMVLNSFNHTIQATDAKKIQTLVYRLMFLLDIMHSLLLSSKWNKESLRGDLTATIFDARVNTKFYSEKIQITASGMDQDIDEVSEYPLDHKIVLKYAPVAQHSRFLWDGLKKTHESDLLASISILTNVLRKRALGDLSHDQILSLLLLDDQISELLNLAPQLELEQILPGDSKDLVVALQDEVSKDTLMEILDPFNFATVSLTEKKAGTTDKFMQFIILLVKVVQLLGIERVLKENTQRTWVITSLLCAHSMSVRLPVQSSQHPTIRGIFDQLIRKFCDDTLWGYLTNTTDDIIDAIVATLFQLSYAKGNIYTMTLVTLLEKLQRRTHMDFGAVASQYLFSRKDDTSKLDTVVSTWQAALPLLCTSLPEDIVNPIKSVLIESLLQRDAEILRRVLGCLVGFYPQQVLPAHEASKFTDLIKEDLPPSVMLHISLAKLFIGVIPHGDLTADQWKVIFSYCLTWLQLIDTNASLAYHCLKLTLSLYKKFCTTQPETIEPLWKQFYLQSITQIVQRYTAHDPATSLSDIFAEIIGYSPVQVVRQFFDGFVKFMAWNSNSNIQSASYDKLIQFVKEQGLPISGEPDTESVGQSVPVAIRNVLEAEQFQKQLQSCTVNQQFGYFLTWSVLLTSLHIGDSSKRTDTGNYIRKSHTGSAFLSNILPFLSSQEPSQDMSVKHIMEQLPATLSLLCNHLYFCMLRTLPIVVRMWWTEDLDRKNISVVEKLTTKYFTPAVIEYELANIQNAKMEYENFRISPNKTSKEASAIYEKDEISVTIVFRFPESYPLAKVEVEGPARSGISEPLWRKWLLSMNALLLTQDYSILDAMLMFKSNLDKHFTGVDVCPICYSLLHATTKTLPNLACKTCKNKFHSPCIYNWISVSHKNDCPLCRSPIY